MDGRVKGDGEIQRYRAEFFEYDVERLTFKSTPRSSTTA